MAAAIHETMSNVGPLTAASNRHGYPGAVYEMSSNGHRSPGDVYKKSCQRSSPNRREQPYVCPVSQTSCTGSDQVLQIGEAATDTRYQKQPQCSRAFPSAGSTPQDHHVAVGRCNITDRQSLSAQSTATTQQALAQRPQRNSAAADTSHEQMVQCVSCAGGRQGKEESGSHKNRCNNKSTARTTSFRKT